MHRLCSLAPGPACAPSPGVRAALKAGTGGDALLSPPDAVGDAAAAVSGARLANQALLAARWAPGRGLGWDAASGLPQLEWGQCASLDVAAPRTPPRVFPGSTRCLECLDSSTSALSTQGPRGAVL
jgi:hypothetical protein